MLHVGPWHGGMWDPARHACMHASLGTLVLKQAAPHLQSALATPPASEPSSRMPRPSRQLAAAPGK